MGRRIFSVKPGLAFRGRKFKGLRGWAGKPLHPPLTDVVVGAYVLVAAFDLISYLTTSRHAYVAGTWVVAGGAVVSLPTLLTGFWDWWKSTPPYTQAWRTANTHMAIMLTVTLVVIADIVWRVAEYDTAVVPVGVLVLSLIVGLLVTVGGTYGGSLTYDYGFNVETAGDHPVWHESEVDVHPGQEATAPTET
jgi:uncharacterized membrane protein